MRQLRGRMDWTRARKPRADQEHEDNIADAAGRRLQIWKEETKIAAALDSAAPGSRAIVGDLRKIGAALNDPALLRLEHYATPIYMIPNAEALVTEMELLVVCLGWDHLERARDWAAVFNEIQDFA